MMFFRSKMPEREHILRSGEKIRIRQLSPAERLHCLKLSGERDFCKRLKWGVKSPKLSLRKAQNLLNNDPFRALEILRAVQQFSKERDLSEQYKYFQMQDEQFLKTLKTIETLKKQV